MKKKVPNTSVSVAKSVFRKVMSSCQGWVCRREFEQQELIRMNERPIEYEFVFRHLARLYPENVLDVGSGTSALPSVIRSCGFLVTATDSVQGFWQSGMFNRHFHVVEDDITDTKITGKFDLITCISVLEHIEFPGLAVRNMAGLLKEDGHIIMTFPYHEHTYCNNVYLLHDSTYGQENPYITQTFSRRELNSWIEGQDLRIVEQTFWKFWTGDFWTTGKQVIPPVQTDSENLHQMTCILLQKT